MKLTASQRKKAIWFLSSIECAVATHEPFNDPTCKRFNKKEIEGFNILCAALGVEGIKQ